MSNLVIKRFSRNHENRGLVLSITVASCIASFILGLIGCGSPGSDPTAQYSDLKATVAPHKEAAREQSVLEAGAYSIEAEKDATLIEGESQSFKVFVRFNQKVDSYDLKLVGVPSDVSGLSLSKVDGETNAFKINWTVPKGTVPSTASARTIAFKLELANVKSSDGAVEVLFRSISLARELKFTVRRTGKRPEIVKDNELPAEVAQGSLVPFTIDIVDPASYDGFAPRLDIYFQGTNKTGTGYEANAATYVRIDGAPKNRGNGVWTFSYVFDTKNNDVGAQLDSEGKRIDGATHLQSRLYLKAYSASGGVSNERVKIIKIKYQIPQVAIVRECPTPAIQKSTTKPAVAVTK